MPPALNRKDHDWEMKKKKPSDHMTNSPYDMQVMELRGLMELRGAEGYEKVKEYQGVTGMCTKLKTNPTTGLSDPQDIALRRQIFGPNSIPVTYYINKFLNWIQFLTQNFILYRRKNLLLF